MQNPVGTRVLGAGLFAIWMATESASIARHCDEQGIPLPFPQEIREYPIAVARAMEDQVNRLLPDHLQFHVHIEMNSTPPHKHYDRHGAEIPCDFYHYLHGQENYGSIGVWDNGSGTLVSTLWVGDEGCLFETRVFSRDPQWNKHTVTYSSQAEAEAGHQAVIEAIQAYPPKS